MKRITIEEFPCFLTISNNEIWPYSKGEITDGCLDIREAKLKLLAKHLGFNCDEDLDFTSPCRTISNGQCEHCTIVSILDFDDYGEILDSETVRRIYYDIMPKNEAILYAFAGWLGFDPLAILRTPTVLKMRGNYEVLDDPALREAILEYAKGDCADYDGDIIPYEGNLYMVHLDYGLCHKCLNVDGIDDASH